MSEWKLVEEKIDSIKIDFERIGNKMEDLTEVVVQLRIDVAEYSQLSTITAKHVDKQNCEFGKLQDKLNYSDRMISHIRGILAAFGIVITLMITIVLTQT